VVISLACWHCCVAGRSGVLASPTVMLTYQHARDMTKCALVAQTRTKGLPKQLFKQLVVKTLYNISEFSYKLIRFLLNSSIVKSDNEIGNFSY